MQKSHLQRHTATHTGERKHVCPVCNKTFIEPGDVRKHMRTHSKETLNCQNTENITHNGPPLVLQQTVNQGDIPDIKPPGFNWLNSHGNQQLTQTSSQILPPPQVQYH